MAKTTAPTEIHIVVYPSTGQLAVIPASPTVDLQSMVKWTLEKGEETFAKDRSKLTITLTEVDGEFLLHFDDVAGFGTPQLKKRGKGGLRALATGTYHYKVAAALGGQIFADLYCPSIIIQRPQAAR